MTDEHAKLIKFLEEEHATAERRYHQTQRALNVARGLVWAVGSLAARLEVVATAREHNCPSCADDGCSLYP